MGSRNMSGAPVIVADRLTETHLTGVAEELVLVIMAGKWGKRVYILPSKAEDDLRRGVWGI